MEPRKITSDALKRVFTDLRTGDEKAIGTWLVQGIQAPGEPLPVLGNGALCSPVPQETGPGPVREMRRTESRGRIR